MPTAPAPNQNTPFVLLVHRRLATVYGAVAYFHDLDPLSELVSSLLSHRTRNSQSARAYRNLKALFPSWEAVRDAPVDQVEEALKPCTWPEQKAPRLQQILSLIGEKKGSLTLDFLEPLPIAEARAWLEELPGVGPKNQCGRAFFFCIAGSGPAGRLPPLSGGVATGHYFGKSRRGQSTRPFGKPVARYVYRAGFLQPSPVPHAPRSGCVPLAHPRMPHLSTAGYMPYRPISFGSKSLKSICRMSSYTSAPLPVSQSGETGRGADVIKETFRRDCFAFDNAVTPLLTGCPHHRKHRKSGRLHRRHRQRPAAHK